MLAKLSCLLVVLLVYQTHVTAGFWYDHVKALANLYSDIYSPAYDHLLSGGYADSDDYDDDDYDNDGYASDGSGHGSDYKSGGDYRQSGNQDYQLKDRVHQSGNQDYQLKDRDHPLGTNRVLTKIPSAGATDGALCTDGKRCTEDSKSLRAVCILEPCCKGCPSGLVYFGQEYNHNTGKFFDTKVRYVIEDVKKEGKHGFHIYTYGDEPKHCKGNKYHYNPFRSVHNLRYYDKYHRHVGDLGNLNLVKQNRGFGEFTDKIIKIEPSIKESIIGRACVLHAKPDQGVIGKKNGMSGAKIAAGTVAYSRVLAQQNALPSSTFIHRTLRLLKANQNDHHDYYL